MKAFKEKWEIQENWQLLFPLLGLIGVCYSAYKISKALLSESEIYWVLIVAVVIAYILIKITLFLFKKLENKWILNYRWEMIRVFIVFAITGSSSMLIGRPIIKFLGITKENLNPILYWVLFIIIGLVFYQILLIIFGWLFGQFRFFWEFEKKMLRRFGFFKDRK
ncbi:DUF6787 family protein [Winogradskyella poriferorum]|uniref:DUF6787 family protein n=1 Tax=Winogradskyella poriferorum TaxID=307627 RepID=UPI003D658B65